MTATNDDPTALRVRHVLVPLDGSELAAEAMPTARELAARFGAPLSTVSVAAEAGEVGDLRDHAAAALAMEGDADVDDRVHVVVDDDPAAAIQRRAAELGDCLVCMSTRGRGRLSGAVVGSVARQVLQGSGVPLVAVGPEVHPVGGSPSPDLLSVPRLVACVDGGEASEQVLPVAAAWARALDFTLSIVTVAEPMLEPNRPGPWNRHHGPDEDADAYIARVAAPWVDAAPTVDAQVVYDPVGPVEGIDAHLDQRPAGLVAVTTHARSGLQRVLLGATAASMIAQARVPVLVVPVRT